MPHQALDLIQYNVMSYLLRKTRITVLQTGLLFAKAEPWIWSDPPSACHTPITGVNAEKEQGQNPLHFLSSLSS